MLIFLKRIKNELFTKKFQGGGQTTGQQVKGGKFVASEVPEYQPIPWVQTPNSYGVLPVFAPGQGPIAPAAPAPKKGVRVEKVSDELAEWKSWYEKQPSGTYQSYPGGSALYAPMKLLRLRGSTKFIGPAVQYVAKGMSNIQNVKNIGTALTIGDASRFAEKPDMTNAGQAFSSLIPISKYWNTFAKPAQKFTNDVMTVNDIMTNGNNK